MKQYQGEVQPHILKLSIKQTWYQNLIPSETQGYKCNTLYPKTKLILKENPSVIIIPILITSSPTLSSIIFTYFLATSKVKVTNRYSEFLPPPQILL